MKIFFPILFVLQENDLVFSSEFDKIASQKTHIKVTPFITHTTQIKIQHDKGSITGSLGKGKQIFYKTINFVRL